MSTSFISSNNNCSVIDLKSSQSSDIYSLFKQTLSLKKNFNSTLNLNRKGICSLLFFEPSTRTRFSFESAAVRAGYHPLVLDGAAGTSLEKGETLEDTILNIEAMKPLFFVIRAPDSLDLSKVSQSIHTPIINAGWGMKGHPTQALLDTVTLFEKWGDLTEKNILFIGDIRHSRVVSSHLELSSVLKYNVAYCAPESLLPTVNQNFLQTSLQAKSIDIFSNLSEALKWADAIVALRVQKERHGEQHFDLHEYIDQFSLTTKHLSIIKPHALIMHPGPINYGIELEQKILTDERAVVLQQVQNGAFLRQALIEQVVKEFLDR